MVCCRPCLLSQQEFDRIPKGICKLESVFKDAAKYNPMVQKFPGILMEDAEDLMAKLEEKLGPNITHDAIMQRPEWLVAVIDNRNLSIW